MVLSYTNVKTNMTLYGSPLCDEAHCITTVIIPTTRKMDKRKRIAYKDCTNCHSFGKKIGESVKVKTKKIKAVWRWIMWLMLK